MSATPDFSDGQAGNAAEMERRARMVHDIQLDECQRQMVLLALAHLAVERPGWLFATKEIALKMDNAGSNGDLEMFEQFRSLHATRQPS